MLLLIRVITYASLFVALLLVYLPARLLSWSGISGPQEFAAPQAIGLILGAAGGVLAVWCIGTFAAVGRGTPAPFDPPRRLVVRGPYRLVRNPMYIGAGLALGGAALYYGSWALLAYASVFLIAAHILVLAYEEPALRRSFGQDYDRYCRRVRRWIPGM